MKKSSLILLAFTLFQVTVEELTPDADCLTNLGTSRGLKISLRSVRNQTGDWVDIFTSRAESSNSSDIINVDVTHRVTECQGKRVVYIQGASKVDPLESSDEKGKKLDKLSFHHRCGENVAILANGRTVHKLKLDNGTHSAAFTSRPLRDNEIFELKVDKKNEKFSNGIMIGVITRSPEDIEIIPEMHISPFARIFLYGNFYSYGKVTFAQYGKKLEEMQVGDRVGVMRNQYGTLHFFVNGVDQGPAASNTPSPVWGIFDLRGRVAMATIVDASSPTSS